MKNYQESIMSEISQNIQSFSRSVRDEYLNEIKKFRGKNSNSNFGYNKGKVRRIQAIFDSNRKGTFKSSRS